MPARHRSRQRALQILYAWDMRKEPVDDAIAAYYGSLYSEESRTRPERDEFIEALVKGTAEKVQEIDSLITSHADNWRLERMPSVDRNILRMAVYELKNTDTPAPVVIDEALELARTYSGEESVHFVNGVLDAVRRAADGAKA